MKRDRGFHRNTPSDPLRIPSGDCSSISGTSCTSGASGSVKAINERLGHGPAQRCWDMSPFRHLWCPTFGDQDSRPAGIHIRQPAVSRPSLASTRASDQGSELWQFTPPSLSKRDSSSEGAIFLVPLHSRFAIFPPGGPQCRFGERLLLLSHYRSVIGDGPEKENPLTLNASSAQPALSQCRAPDRPISCDLISR